MKSQGLPNLNTRGIRWIGPALVAASTVLGCVDAEPEPAPEAEGREPTSYEERIAERRRQQRSPAWARMEALHAAVSRGDSDLVRHYLKSGVPADAADVNGRTPLMKSAQLGDLDLVDLLLAEGADPNVENVFGGTALIEAAAANHPRVLHRLLQAGAYVNAENDRHQTALYLAARDGYTAAVRVLLLAGADVDADTLRRAESGGHADVVELLRNAR